MQRAMIWAATTAALLTASATIAQAEEWCGYKLHDNAVIECGYTTIADCESATGKGGMCFIDPEYALNAKRGKRFVSRQSQGRS
jgi:hypothetical protein